MNKYLRLMRIDKPIGIYLLLWPTLWALFLAANGMPSIKLLIIFTLGTIIMRSAGCVINDYADRKIDKLVKRTNTRPITTGEVSVKAGLILFMLLLLCALLLVAMTNLLTLYLAIIAALLAGLYPFTKRWTNMPQLILGLAYAMSIPMAFSATNNEITYASWLVFITAVVWTIIYDTMYAIVDRDDDIKIGVKSSAILFASKDLLIIAILQIIFLLGLINIGLIFELDIIYYCTIVISAGIMVYHQFLIKDYNREKCFKAFLHNHYIGMVIFIGIAASIIKL